MFDYRNRFKEIELVVVVRFELKFDSAVYSGTGQGLKLTLNIEKDEYMSGPLAGSGTMVGVTCSVGGSPPPPHPILKLCA